MLFVFVGFPIFIFEQSASLKEQSVVLFEEMYMRREKNKQNNQTLFVFTTE